MNEIPTCKEILSMHSLYTKPTLICCPTCGRTEIDLISIANEVEEKCRHIDKNIK